MNNLVSKKLTPIEEDSIRKRHALVEQSDDKWSTAKDMAYLSHLDRQDLLAEIEWLRAALFQYACHCGPTDPNPAVHADWCSYRQVLLGNSSASGMSTVVNAAGTAAYQVPQFIEGQEDGRTLVEELVSYITATSDRIAFAKVLQKIEVAIGSTQKTATPETSPNPFRRRLAMLETTGPTNLPRLEISFQTLSDMQAASDWLRSLGREAPRTSEELTQETSARCTDCGGSADTNGKIQHRPGCSIEWT